MPQSILYGATGAGLVAVAYIAIMHMSWWDQFNKQGFEAKKRQEGAAQQANDLSNKLARQKQLAQLEQNRITQEHRLTMEKIKHEQELELARIRAEQEMHQTILAQKLAHKQEVANQVSAKMKAKIGQISSKVAEKEADELTNQFLAEYGLPIEARSQNGHGNGANLTDPKSS